MHKHQLAIFDGESVIYDDIYPFAKLPELKHNDFISQNGIMILHNQDVSLKITWKWKIPA